MLTRKFDWDEDRTAQAIRAIENAATVIDSPPWPEVIGSGHTANQVLQCAVAASADYLVIGNRRHLLPIGEHQGSRIINAPVSCPALGRLRGDGVI